MSEPAGAAASRDVVALMVFKQPEHVDWLLRRLTGEGGVVVLHVDRKALPSMGSWVAGWRHRPGVHLVPDSVVVNWGGFSQVRATLACLTLARQRVPGLRRVHLMSGECLPLRPLTEIAAVMDRLSRAGESDLIESKRRPAVDWRVNRFNILGEHPRNREPAFDAAFVRFRKLQQRLGLPPRRNFAANEILFGGQWWSMHGSSVQRLLGWPGLSDFVQHFRWTRCADEHFFQMLHHRLGLRAVGSQRFCDFPAGQSSPRYLPPGELHRLRERGVLFARKVTPEVARQYVAEADGAGA